MRLPGSRLLTPLAWLALGSPLLAVEPGLRIYADEFPSTPLTRIVFGHNASGVALSTLTREGYATGQAMEAAAAWDFSLASGADRVVEFAPVSNAYSCYVPGGCAGLFDPARSDLLFLQMTPGLTRDVSALEFNGTDTWFLRAQATDEGSTGEVRVCFSQDVPFAVFPNSDGPRRYLAETDPGWSSPVYRCVQAVTQDGPCGAGGTDAYLSDGNGTSGTVTGRAARAGTLTLPSGHVVDAMLVRTYASLEAYGARVFSSCQLPVQRLRQFLFLWFLEHHGPVLQISSAYDVADLASFTTTGSTVLGYGLLPPVSIAVTAVGPDSITVAWDPGRLGGYTPDSYDVSWGPDPGTTTPPPFQANTAATSYTISGLARDARYCVSVSSVKSFTNDRSGVPVTYKSIAMPLTVGADIDGDGTRDTQYPPEVCVTTNQPLLNLLRDGFLAIDPPNPARSLVLPLDPLLDVYRSGWVPGSVDPTPLASPLTVYAYAPPRTIYLVKASGGIRVE